MNVTCPNCATIYRVDPAKVPESGVRARCNVCSAVFAVRHEAANPIPPALAHASAPAPAAASTPPASPAAPPAPPAPPPVPVTAAPAHAPPPAPSMPVMAPPAAPRPVGTPLQPAGAAPAGAPRPAAPPRPFAPKASSAPPTPTPPAPAPARATTPAAPPLPTRAPAAPVAAAPRPATPGRAVNPFLSQDPALKARRLARALISDMVVYHPGKRQDGLRDGTLKELFEEEIKKSWEEYAEQVGREVADSTPYFKEALNEILAGGRQIF